MSYYDTSNPPLLLQGFTRQFINVGTGTIKDTKPFTLDVNRGIVNYIDYSTVDLSMITGFSEQFWNDAVITCTAGGSDLLTDVPAERFDYNLDLGVKADERVKTNINGGQQLKSTISISNLTDSTVPAIQTQMHAYYTSEKLEAWRRSYQWKNGQGLKRQSFNVSYKVAAATYGIVGTIPRNQGNVVGFSITYLAPNAYEGFVTFKVDGINLIENVGGERFSRASQKLPYVFLIPLNPGSTFALEIEQLQTVPAPGSAFVTFYFDN